MITSVPELLRVRFEHNAADGAFNIPSAPTPVPLPHIVYAFGLGGGAADSTTSSVTVDRDMQLRASVFFSGSRHDQDTRLVLKVGGSEVETMRAQENQALGAPQPQHFFALFGAIEVAAGETIQMVWESVNPVNNNPTLSDGFGSSPEQTTVMVEFEEVPRDSLLDGKGQLLVGDGADGMARLAPGADGDLLMADSSAPGGLAWGAAPEPCTGFKAVKTVPSGPYTTEDDDFGKYVRVTQGPVTLHVPGPDVPVGAEMCIRALHFCHRRRPAHLIEPDGWVLLGRSVVRADKTMTVKYVGNCTYETMGG